MASNASSIHVQPEHVGSPDQPVRSVRLCYSAPPVNSVPSVTSVPVSSVECLRRLQLLVPLLIDARKSWLVFVFDIRDSSSSIASTGESGVSTFLRTHTRLRSSFGMSN